MTQQNSLIFLSAMASKKQDDLSGALGCANCDVVGSPYACSRCKLVYYCSKACQAQHWNAMGGHKRFCVSKEHRKPPQADESKRKRRDDKSSHDCAICLDNLTASISCTLPCSHTFHMKCVEMLQAVGVAHGCPSCRARLPIVPRALENLFENVTP